MESIALIGPPPRWGLAARHPEPPTGHELSMRAQGAAARAAAAIERIDRIIGDNARCSSRSYDATRPRPKCPPARTNPRGIRTAAIDRRVPRVPIEHRSLGRVLALR